MIFFITRRMTRETRPKISEGKLICPNVAQICSASSGNSPVPAVPPINLGTCMRIIVVQIPVIKPPITGAEI